VRQYAGDEGSVDLGVLLLLLLLLDGFGGKG